MIQTIGRAARNSSGKVILYGDKITDSMAKAIEETNRRRKIQDEFNQKNNIVPKTIIKNVRDILEITYKGDQADRKPAAKLKKKEMLAMIKNLEKEMAFKAKDMKFEEAAELRDLIFELKTNL